MKIILEVDDIDYGQLAEKLLPIAREKMGGSNAGGVGGMLKSLMDLPAPLVKAMVNAMPQKEQKLAQLAEQYGDKLAGAAQGFLEKQGLSAKVTGIRVEP